MEENSQARTFAPNQALVKFDILLLFLDDLLLKACFYRVLNRGIVIPLNFQVSNTFCGLGTVIKA